MNRSSYIITPKQVTQNCYENLFPYCVHYCHVSKDKIRQLFLPLALALGAKR